eukprot:gene17591-19344_t
MEDKGTVHFKSAGIGLVNKAFAASVDESEHETQRLASDLTANSRNIGQYFEQTVADIVDENRCNNEELKPDGRQVKPDGDVLESRHTSSIKTDRNENSRALNSRKHIDQEDSVNQINQAKNDSNIIISSSSYTEPELRHRSTSATSIDNKKKDGHVDMLRHVEEGDTHYHGEALYHHNAVASLQNEKTTNQLQDQDIEAMNELTELNVSVMSDGTEFYYTPKVSPRVSPPSMAALRKKSCNVTFDETYTEIAQDSLEFGEDSSSACVDPNLSFEEDASNAEQEFLRRLVDPTQKFFVCMLSCNHYHSSQRFHGISGFHVSY